MSRKASMAVGKWSSAASLDTGWLGGLQLFLMMMLGDRLELRGREEAWAAVPAAVVKTSTYSKTSVHSSALVGQQRR